MGKKISKKASAIRTISLAVGSLSLLVIAITQVSYKELCTSSAYSIENQIRLSWFVFLIWLFMGLDFFWMFQEIF